MENLILRSFGSLALGGLLIHAGLDAPFRAFAGLYLVPFFILAIAANWALARLNVKRPALWATTLLLGLGPVLMLLAHASTLDARSTLYVGVLYATAAFGAVTLAFGLVTLRSRAAPDADASAA